MGTRSTISRANAYVRMARADLLGHSTRAQVEQRLLVETPHGCAVGALDVVGEDLEARPGVDLGVVREEQVLVRLAGVGAGRLRADDDVPVEHAVPVFVHHALVELTAGAARCGVHNQDRVVVVLVAAGHVQAVEADVCPFAVEVDPHLVACDVRPEREHVGRKVALAILADVEEREVERGAGLVLDLVVRDIGARAPG